MKLGILKLSDIDFGDRKRTHYTGLNELAHSIKERGLICPIAVEERGGQKYLLAAGGRRYKAMEILEREEIACRIYDHPLNELELRGIELYENIHREALSYQDEVRMKKELLEIEQEVKGIKVTTRPGDSQGASLRDTASLLGKSPATLSMDIKLARAMETFSDLDWASCKNKSEAHKMLRRIERRMEYSSASDKIEALKETTLDVQKQKLIDSYIVGDFHDHALRLPDDYFHIIEIDPPYAMGLDHSKKRTGVGNYSYGKDGYDEISAEDYPDFMLQTLELAYKVAAKDSWTIVWFAPEPWTELMYKWILDVGFSTKRIWGHWTKPGGQTHRPTEDLANAVEHFYYCKKGEPKIAKPGRTNSFIYNPVPPAQKTHPTERPLDLMEDIVSTFAMPGSRILVPFGGSGKTLLAAWKLGIQGVCYDLQVEYKEAYNVGALKFLEKGE